MRATSWTVGACATILVAVCALVTAEQCTLDELRPQFGPCEVGMRSMQLLPPEGGVCDGSGMTSQVGCECVAADYSPRYSECQNGLRSLTYEKHGNCTGGLPVPKGVENAPCACTAEDVGHAYTPCDTSSSTDSSTRSLVYYFKNDCDARATDSVRLKVAVHNIPCELACAPGQYLPLGGRLCQQCPAGQYSVGGGHRYMTWTDWPRGFETRCTSTIGEAGTLHIKTLAALLAIIEP